MGEYTVTLSNCVEPENMRKEMKLNLCDVKNCPPSTFGSEAWITEKVILKYNMLHE